MKQTRWPWSCLGYSVLAALATPTPAQQPARSHGWTTREAYEQLVLDPRDPFLQYVTLQLARRDHDTKQWARRIAALQGQDNWRRGNEPVDLFDLFSGALAVQESLQLETMRDAQHRPYGEHSVPIATLSGPTLQGHPWTEMLAGRKPKVSRLASCVPHDQYFVLFQSLTKLSELTSSGHDWGMHLFQQADQDARKQLLLGPLQEQLAIETNPMLRPFYDLVVAEVAMTGNDLYLREGSDITVLFRAKNPKLLRQRMDAFLAKAEAAHSDSKRTQGTYLGVTYDHLTAGRRAVHVFAAWPSEDLHVRSNSLAGLQRVIEAIRGERPDHTKVTRLGETDEYRYIRTLMPFGAAEEDGFVYLSDPFIRRVVGPVTKLTERRRLRCFNHLQMIAHAALLFATENERLPKSLAEISTDRYSPAEYGQNLVCPDGGNYAFDPVHMTGVCSIHGRPGALVPCLETAVTAVSPQEADEYERFQNRYNRYWSRYFDPIAVRISTNAKRHRLETIVLPLIDNSLYTGLASLLAGEPAPLAARPVPERTMFSLALNWKQGGMQKAENLGDVWEWLLPRAREFEFQFDEKLMRRAITEGFGQELGVHVYDSQPMFDFRLTEAVGDLMTVGGRPSPGQALDGLLTGALVASLNAPVFVDVGVRDPALVDEFLAHIDGFLARVARRHRRSRWWQNYDFTKLPLAGGKPRVRCLTMNAGPLKLRVFWARIGRRFVLASRRFILDDIAKLDTSQRGPGDSQRRCHAFARIDATAWQQVLPAYLLGWADNQRRSCLNNLGALASLTRPVLALKGTSDSEAHMASVTELAQKLYRQDLLCPDGGKYVFSSDGERVRCTVHGTIADPSQPVAPARGVGAGRLLHGLSSATAELTFLEDGLHAVLTIEGRRQR